MQGSLDNPPMVIRAGRGRGALVLLFAAMLLASGGLRLSGSGGFNGFALAMLVASALVGAMGLWMVVAPARLEIGPGGVSQKVLWRNHRYAWNEVYDFRPVQLGGFSKTVGFDFLIPRRKSAALLKFNASVTGVQAIFQPGFEVKPVELADLLNRARERWLDARPGAAEPDRPATPPPMASGFVGARMSRKIYWIAIAAVTLLSVGLSFLPGLGTASGGISLVFFIRIYATRLHDIGRSGWWQLGLYAVQIAAAIAFAAGGASIPIVTYAALLVQLIFTIVLGVIPGNPAVNRFGPPPGQPSAAARSEVFR